jgi:hypothetical protein
MWTTSHSLVADVSAAQVWRVWRDLPNWPSWDQGLVWVRPDGDMRVGGQYTLKPKGGFAVRSTITRSEPEQGFTDTTHLPLCTLEFEHTLEPADGGLRITHRATFRGPATPFFRRVIGGGIERDLPETMARLVERARIN